MFDFYPGLAFHPFDRLLVVATSNELHFWDWSAASRPFAKVRTSSEKVTS